MILILLEYPFGPIDICSRRIHYHLLLNAVKFDIYTNDMLFSTHWENLFKELPLNLEGCKIFIVDITIISWWQHVITLLRKRYNCWICSILYYIPVVEIMASAQDSLLHEKVLLLTFNQVSKFKNQRSYNLHMCGIHQCHQCGAREAETGSAGFKYP